MEDTEPSNGSYPPDHSQHSCDRCLKEVGNKNLQPLNFLYMDKNDKTHEDKSPSMGTNIEPGYRHYSTCRKCFVEQEERYEMRRLHEARRQH